MIRSPTFGRPNAEFSGVAQRDGQVALDAGVLRLDLGMSIAAALHCAATARRMGLTNPEPHVLPAHAYRQPCDLETDEDALRRTCARGQSRAMVHAVAAISRCLTVGR